MTKELKEYIRMVYKESKTVQWTVGWESLHKYIGSKIYNTMTTVEVTVSYKDDYGFVFNDVNGCEVIVTADEFRHGSAEWVYRVAKEDIPKPIVVIISSSIGNTDLYVKLKESKSMGMYEIKDINTTSQMEINEADLVVVHAKEESTVIGFTIAGFYMVGIRTLYLSECNTTFTLPDALGKVQVCGNARLVESAQVNMSDMLKGW